MRPIIVTAYNQQIDAGIVYHQQLVVNKFRNGIPFFPYNYTGSDMMHGDALNRLVHKMFYEYQQGADCMLILDIDCVPLSTQALENTIHAAYQGCLVGNAQRSNHLQNNQHVYAAPSYLAFTKQTYEQAGSPTMNFNHTYDCGELLTVNCTRHQIPVKLLMPTCYDSLNPDGELWKLADGMPKYGIGTQFAWNGHPTSYHLFCSRFQQYNHLFYSKCQQLMKG